MSDSCDPTDCSPPASSVHGILQARILEWVAISFSRNLPDPGITRVSCTVDRFFRLSELWGKPQERWNKYYRNSKKKKRGLQDACGRLYVRSSFPDGSWKMSRLLMVREDQRVVPRSSEQWGQERKGCIRPEMVQKSGLVWRGVRVRKWPESRPWGTLNGR